jgi:hypothetical protein
VGRLSRLGRVAAAAALATAWIFAGRAPAAAFDGFGKASADGTYGAEIRFEVELQDGAPDRLDLLLSLPGVDAEFVAPVEPSGSSATYVWDTATEYVTPNSHITYQWRAIVDGQETLSTPGTLLYDDDREGLDWQTATVGEATVHWYDDAEAQATRFGELTAGGVTQAEELFGVELAGPVDIFVYDSQDEFFGALGPGTREWTGAAAFPELRTIFMWLQGGSQVYLETAIVHEVTHVVFHDATDNPYHEPATWLNEGIAVWSETREAGDERAVVESEAAGQGLLAFEALTARFPIDDRGGRLAYAEGAAMIDMLIERYGTDALAQMTAAYREGATDAEALEAGTGVAAEALYDEFYAAFGADEPQPIAAEEILPSDVELPPGASDGGSSGAPDEPGEPDGAPAAPGERDDLPAPWLVIGVLAVAAAGALAAAWFVIRRAAKQDRSG